MAILWILLAFLCFCVFMFFRARRKREDNHNNVIMDMCLNTVAESNRETGRTEAEEREGIDIHASVVYSYLIRVRHIMDSPIYHIREMNEVLEELVASHDEITCLSVNSRYKEFCARAIAMHVEDHEVRPTNKILGFLSSEDKRLAFITRLKSSFAADYVLYWDGVLRSYKQKPAKMNRIQYLIDQITEFNDPESLLGSEAIIALNDYKSKLETMLE